MSLDLCCAAGKARDVARRRLHDPDAVIVPTEYAHAPAYRNPPGATALKMLHAMIDYASWRLDLSTLETTSLPLQSTRAG